MGSTKKPATFEFDSKAFSRATKLLYSILIKPDVYGPKLVFATGSLEKDIIVVVLP